MHRKLAIVGFFFLLTATAFGAEERLDAFVGTWNIDYDATLKEARRSPKYRPGDEKVMRKVIRRIADSTTLAITESELSFVVNSKASVMAYEIKSQTPGRAVLVYKNQNAEAGNAEATLTLEARMEGRLNLRSSLTNDMDYYIWRRADAKGK